MSHAPCEPHDATLGLRDLGQRRAVGPARPSSSRAVQGPLSALEAKLHAINLATLDGRTHEERGTIRLAHIDGLRVHFAHTPAETRYL